MANPTPADIREYLTSAYSDEEITTLCSDHFRTVYDSFAAGMSKGQKTQSLLDYCQRREIISNLITVLKKDRPEQFEKHLELRLYNLSPEPPDILVSPQRASLTRWLMGIGIVVLLLAAFIAALMIKNPCIAGSTKVSRKDYMTLICVPSGDFLMGSAGTDPDAMNVEKPQRKVELGAFWIDRTEVTNAMYAECVRQGACRIPQETRSATHDIYYDDVNYRDYPVVYVLWEDARKYCEWVGWRLPTEAEWEKAARGVDGQIYPWGDEKPDDQRANYGGKIGDTTPVDRYPAGASPYGALDMAGNVWEWTEDWYDESYYQSAPMENPQGPDHSAKRVTRGSSYSGLYDYTHVRAAYRGDYDPLDTNDNIGFRCALSPFWKTN